MVSSLCRKYHVKYHKEKLAKFPFSVRIQIVKAWYVVVMYVCTVSCIGLRCVALRGFDVLKLCCWGGVQCVYVVTCSRVCVRVCLNTETH